MAPDPIQVMKDTLMETSVGVLILTSATAIGYKLGYGELGLMWGSSLVAAYALLFNMNSEDRIRKFYEERYKQSVGSCRLYLK